MTAGSSATEPASGGGRRYAVVSRRRPGFMLQRPDGSALAFDTEAAAQAVCAALNREDPNDEAPEYQTKEVGA